MIVVIALLAFSCRPEENIPRSSTLDSRLEGWNILTDNDTMAVKVIDKAAGYGINHLQLSHQIVMDLKDVKDPEVAAQVNRLTDMAHDKGIGEVTIWDHSLYHLGYYPDKFKTGPGGTIDLDNPGFWEWIKKDMRNMLDMVPAIDGIILTFIETGAHVEDQYSAVLATEEEKLSAMVDTLASVIINERDLSLYIRTFIYSRAELSSLLKAIELVKNPAVKVMTKEAPHDFFLTHPVSSFVGKIKAPVLIEFDAAHEYNGQGIIASIFPETHLKRWQYYSGLSNVTGYVARTDRLNTTSIINNPTEINLFALHKAAGSESPVEMESIYNEFIEENYGESCIPYLKPAFKLAPDIILSTLYTLGLPLNSHSRLDIENGSAYQRHVSGKWLDNKNIHLGRGNDTTLHYWKDIVNHLAPAWYKGEESGQLAVESRWVLDSNWLEPTEKMNEAYLKLVLNEKEYGARKAREALNLVKDAEDCTENRVLYDTTRHIFSRTSITADLYLAMAKAYFGYRVFARGEEYRTDFIHRAMKEGLDELPVIIDAILTYPHKGPVGQYHWVEDAYRAMHFYIQLDRIINSGDYGYTPSTFERIPYRGLSDKEREEIHSRYRQMTRH